MKRPTFINTIIAAALFSIGGAGLLWLLPLFMSLGFSVYLCVVILCIAYCAYLCTGKTHKTGYLSACALLLIALSAGLFFSISILGFVSFCILLLWIFRCQRFHTNSLSVLLDLILFGSGMIAALLTFQQTNSVFLTLWTFFLLQSLFVLIPQKSHSEISNFKPKLSTFDTAYNQAQNALSSIISNTK